MLVKNTCSLNAPKQTPAALIYVKAFIFTISLTSTSSPRWLHTDCTQAPRPMPVAQCTHMSKTWAWFAFIHGTSITGSSDAVNVLAPFLWWDFIVTSPYCQTHACKGLLHLCTLHRISWKQTSCSLPFLYDYQHTCQFIQEGHGVDQPPIQ